VPVNPRHRFGLHDWKRLLAASTDLAQRKGAPLRRDITPEEVAQHNRNHDGWIILRGKVYTIGPYLPYHPGGVNILRGVLGKDATPLFDKYHRWVNIDGLIGPLMLGTVVATTTPKPNPYSVIPPKESHLGNPPRVPVGGSLLLVPPSKNGDDDDEDEEEDDDHLLLPPPPPRSSSSS
jgi:cytochrome-b5 reductase